MISMLVDFALKSLLNQDSGICHALIVLHYFSFRHNYEEVKKITDFLLSKTSYRPTIGVICGSGLGGLVNSIEEKFALDYADIPGFPVSTGEFQGGV